MKILGIVACLGCFGTAVETHAVSLSADGSGQALLYPYYTVRGTNDTLFSVANPYVSFALPGPRFKAAKVRFREGRNSRVVLDFNLYLAPGMIFTAMVTRDAAGNPVLRTQSEACTVPLLPQSSSAPGWREVAFSNANYLNYDKGGNDLSRAREGFFEVIEMGEPIATFGLSAQVVLGDAITYADPLAPTGKQNCAAVASAWSQNGAFLSSSGAEVGKPTGGLIGMATIVNVFQGTDYSFDPVALSDVYSTSHHTPPGATSPSLADATPHSVVIANGHEHVGTWTHGIDAVSAVLMREAVQNEYIASTPTLDAATDIVLTYPTASGHVSLASSGNAATAPFQYNFDDVNLVPPSYTESRGACQPVSIERYSPDGRKNGTSSGTYTPSTPLDPAEACWATTVLGVGDVFGSANASPLVTHMATRSGGINIRFSREKPLVSIEGDKYYGLPVIGFSAQKYINGNLNGALSNYGGVLAHKYRISIE